MVNRYAQEQLALVAKMVMRTATRRERERFDKNFARWLREEWSGNEELAIASCVDAVATACGGLRGEWGQLSGQEQTAMVRYFSMAYLPTQNESHADAKEFVVIEIRRGGFTMKQFAQYLVALFGNPGG
ncbi:hypothetical protein [Streptomyces lavendulae]|uniref:hypothetical protein n=1 Tax=Streptomyces lavendulae TaxID=1914 RepID=UPI0031E9B444